MQTEVRISETEYKQLFNAAKRSNKEIDRKAYQIAEKLNKIDVSIEIEQDGYRSSELHVSIDGSIENYCIKSKEYRDMPDDLRDLIRRLNKDLLCRIKRGRAPFIAQLARLQAYNMRIFLVAMLLVFTNIITLLILLCR